MRETLSAYVLRQASDALQDWMHFYVTREICNWRAGSVSNPNTRLWAISLWKSCCGWVTAPAPCPLPAAPTPMEKLTDDVPALQLNN